ncbi:MAG: hypothetical protein R6V26_11110 [Roseovarius sp.]
MNIEPKGGDGPRIAWFHGTAAAAAGWSRNFVAEDLKEHNRRTFSLRTVIAIAITLFCFKVLPHPRVGVS